jgi:hypothetical protein
MKLMKKIVVFGALLVIFFSSIVKGQDSGSYTLNFNRTYDLVAGYYGVQITHPGLRIGLETPLYAKVKDSEGKRRIQLAELDSFYHQKIIKKVFFVRPNLVFYYHNQNHMGLLINAEYVKRRVSRWNSFREMVVGVGYLRTFLGETYEVDDAGNVDKKILAGNGYFAPSFTLFIGKDYHLKNKDIAGFYMGPTLFLLVPYNSFFSASFSIEFGLRYKLF